MAESADSIISTLKAILAEDLNLNLDKTRIDEHVPLLEDGLGLDSIVLVELIGVVESKFGFQFQDSDLRTASFKNLRTLAETISKRIGE